MKIRIMKFGGYFFLFLSCVNCYAISQNGIQPAMVGFEGDGKNAYIGISQNPNGCLYSGIYFVASPDSAKAAVKTAMVAKLAGKTLRIDYTGGNGGQCFGYNIYVE